MNKKQTLSAILAGIAISAILVTSSLITGSQISHQALAQQGGTTSPPTTASPATTPPPTSTSKSAAESTSSKPISQQGTVSSMVSPLGGRTRDQVAVILPPKAGVVYTGVISFTSSKGIQPEVWNLATVNASTPIPRGFGTLTLPASPTGKGLIATALVGSPSTSNSLPFTGSGLALHGRAPFIATYTVTWSAAPAKSMNNLSSLTAPAAGATLGGTTGGATLGGTTGGATLGGTTGGATLGGGSSGSGGGSSGSGGGSSGSRGG
jgi:hypothetical protein